MNDESSPDRTLAEASNGAKDLSPTIDRDKRLADALSVVSKSGLGLALASFEASSLKSALAASSLSTALLKNLNSHSIALDSSLSPLLKALSEGPLSAISTAAFSNARIASALASLEASPLRSVLATTSSLSPLLKALSEGPLSGLNTARFSSLALKSGLDALQKSIAGNDKLFAQLAVSNDFQRFAEVFKSATNTVDRLAIPLLKDLNLPSPVKSLRFALLTNSCESFYSSLRELSPSPNPLSSTLVELPIKECLNETAIFAASETSDKTPPTANETEVSLISLLDEHFPTLVPAYRGARLARFSNNPDRIRHFSVSWRELFTHLIHELAPDEKLKAWSKNKNDFHEGRPTRAARLRFIYGYLLTDGLGVACNLESEDLKKCLEFLEQFVIRDAKSVLAWNGVLQQGTHGIQPNLSELSLVALQARFDGFLRFILELYAFRFAGKS